MCKGKLRDERSENWPFGSAVSLSASFKSYPPGFTSRLGLKDLGLALGLAEDLGVNLPTGAVLRGIFEEAVKNVGEDLDWASIAEVTKRRADHDRHQP